MTARLSGWWLVVLLQGCALLDTSEPKIVGPSAVIADSENGGGSAGGDFFILQEIDGVPAKWDSRRASLQLSRGQGVNLRLAPYERRVPVGRKRLKLYAAHDYSAPIQSMLQSAHGGAG